MMPMRALASLSRSVLSGDVSMNLVAVAPFGECVAVAACVLKCAYLSMLLREGGGPVLLFSWVIWRSDRAVW